MDEQLYICIDIGGTTIKHGVADEAGRFVEAGELPTNAREGGEAIMNRVKGTVRKYADRLQTKQHVVPAGVCVSTAGMVDVESGTVTYAAPLIPNYTGTCIKEEIEKTCHLPCEVENDVNCAGLAEAVSGAARTAASCLCLTVGTGIGGAFLLEGRVYHGFSGSACEVGYMHLPGGQFQDMGAASVLVDKVKREKDKAAREQAAKENAAKDNAVRDCGMPEQTGGKNIALEEENLSAIDGKYVFTMAKQGDAICVRAIEEMCDVLAMGIANLCYVLNPEVVVLGGGIMAQRDYLGPVLDVALSKYMLEGIRKQTRVTFAMHENRAGMLGALYHFRQRRGAEPVAYQGGIQ